MARNFLTAINLNKNELQNAAVQNLAAAPSAPAKGQLYYNSTGGDDTLYWYNGSQWIAAKAAAGATPAATVTTQAVGDAPVVGISTNFAREDHKHGREAFGAVTAETVFGSASGNGAAATLARSDHTHGNPVHNAAAHSAIPISALAAATASISMGGFQINGLAGPSVASDAATKNYVDNNINGNSWKQSVRVASTGNMALTGSFAIDGVTPTADVDRVLVKNQTNGAENGIYFTSSGAWYRTSDADAGNELLQASVFVQEGTINGDTAWTCTTNSPIVIGTTPTTWAQFAGGGAVVAGTGLAQTGNTLNFVAGDTSLTVAADDVRVNTAVIASVASLAGYVPTARQVIAGAGLVNGGALTGDVTLNVGAGTGLSVAADAVAVNGAVVPYWSMLSYAANVGGATTAVVNHLLNTLDVIVDVFRVAAPRDTVDCDVERTDVNNVTLRFAVAPAAGEYRCVVMGHGL